MHPTRLQTQPDRQDFMLHMKKAMKFLMRWFKSIRGLDTPFGGVSWEPNQISDKECGINFPSDSGLQEELQNDGYTISWCSQKKLSRKLDIEGFEKVIWDNKNGDQFYLRTHDGLTLIKRKKAM
jgi:hypothetical protein